MDGCKDETSHQLAVLEHVVCKVTLRHNPRGSLHLVLISPMGTRSSLLLPRPKDRTDKAFESWPFLSVHFWGEPPNGTWTLEVTAAKSNSRKPGVLLNWQLILYGTADLSPLAIPQSTEINQQVNNLEGIPDDLDAEENDLLTAVLGSTNEQQDVSYEIIKVI